MKVVRFIALAALVGSSLSGCGSSSSSVASLASNPMVTSLMSSVTGISADQAIAGAGGLLGLSKDKLDGDSWKKVASAVPGADALVEGGLKSLGLSGDLNSLADMSGGFSKMNLSPDKVDQMVPAMGDFMTKGGHAEAADLFKGAVR
jgi:hypothetical protein